MKKPFAFLAISFCLNTSFSQTSLTPYRNTVQSDQWSFDFSSGASFAPGSNENTLFRGNSLATKLSGRYTFGTVGLGFSGGLVPGSISTPAINRFMQERKLDPSQTQVAMGSPSNGYLLFGPSIRFGRRIVLMAEVQGGMFLNDPGSVSISQNGIQRSTYRFDGGSKNLFPGFSGTLQLAYPVSKSSRFFINTDYFNSRSTIRLVDLQSGIDVATEQNRNLRLFTAGIGFTKTFGGRDASSAQASGKRHIGNVKYEDIALLPAEESVQSSYTTRETGTGRASGRILPVAENTILTSRDAGSGMATGRRTYQPGQPVYGNIAIAENEILTSRDAGSGMATGRRIYQPGQPVYGNIAIAENEILTSRDAGSGMASGRRTYQPGQPVYGNITSRDAGSGMATGRRTYQPGQPVYGNLMTTESCGAVTQTITYPDGRTEENTFACPADAVQYARETANTNTARQTPNTSFGQRSVGENQNNIPSRVVHRDLGVRNIISGRVSWSSPENNPGYAIVTNNTVRGGSATLNSQNSATRQTNQSSFGTLVRNGIIANIYSREAGSGIATGKRSSGRDVSSGIATGKRSREAGSGIATGKRSGRDAGSGMATGRRQYSPVFFEGEDGAVCNPCATSVVTNPLFEQGSNSGHNPMAERKAITGNNVDENCDGVASVNVYLLDAASRAIIAKTNTESCGDFFFANVPDGDYIVKISGSMTIKKKYDITIDNSGSKDISGELLAAADSWSLQLNISPDSLTNTSDRIKTKSNIKNDRVSFQGSNNGDSNSETYLARIKSNVKNNRTGASSPDDIVIRKALPVATGDVDGDGRSEIVIGGFLPGGPIVSSAFTAIGPIKGVIVKGGRNPGGEASRTTTTNEYGEFEFTDLEAGSHFISTEQSIRIDDETFISSVDGGAPEQRGFNQNASRSNHTRLAANMSNEDAPGLRIQNNNTVRSNRGQYVSILIEADVDGDGEYETDISNSHVYTLSEETKTDTGDPQTKAGISTSRSNIRTKSSLQPVGDDLYVAYGSTTLNGKQVEIRSVLKTKHDTAKNSVGNIR